MKNENALLIIFIILFILAFISFVVLIGAFIIKFNKKTRFIIKKMNSADNRDKYIQMRKTLHCHYLCLIPFVNKRNVLKLYNLIFYKPKHQSVKKRTDGMWHILAPSAIAICICAVCLCGASWAWFTASQTSSVTVIHTATYTVDVTAAIDETPAEVTSDSGVYTVSLENGKAYKITITANGTANTGFCTVALGEQTYHTPQIEKNTSFAFEVSTYQSGILTITPQWGTCAASENVINSETPLELGTKPNNSKSDNTVFATPQPSENTPEVSAPKPDDTTEPADTPQGEENTTAPKTENTQPETTLPENKTDPVSEETTASETTSTTDDAEITEAENTTE